MMLLARAITQKLSTPTINCLCSSSNTRNQVVIQDGRVDIQTKNAGYGGNGNKNTGRQNRNEMDQLRIMKVIRLFSILYKLSQIQERQMFNVITAMTKHYARDCQKLRVRNAKYFREQMLLAMKDEDGSNLNDEENHFMLDSSFRDERLEELTAAVIMMARIQPADDNTMTEPTYDAKAVSELLIMNKIIKGSHKEILKKTSL
nr:hypothetical protein [Tanacetum cinerariifolium]